jgi:Tfp pilus assembly protein PilN
MIEINLLPGKRRKAPGAGLKLQVPDFRALLAQVKDPWLLAAAASALLCGAGVLYYLFERTRLAALDAQVVEMRAERRKFDAYITELRRAERLRDSLVAEIGVIRGIDADRYTWPHILDQVSKALPPYTWLVDVSSGAPPVAAAQPGTPADSGVRGVRVNVTGRTVDIQAYTTFLRQLANSPWLTDVTPAQSLTKIENDRPVTEFNLSAAFRVADSIYMRTVPMGQRMR